MAELVDVIEIVVPDGEGDEALGAVKAMLEHDDKRSPGLEDVQEVRLTTQRKREA